MYSQKKKKNSFFCLCCKLFSTKNFSMTKGGLNDRKNASTLLTSHENAPEPLRYLKTWKELEVKMVRGNHC